MRQAYRKMMDKVSPSPELVEAAVRGRHVERRPRMGRRMIAAAVAVALCLAIPALGARVEPIYRLMYLVSPSVAQFFVPVERSCVSSGVEMELVAARLEGDTAQFYITLKDLEGDVLDGTVDLYDSYSIRSPFDSTGTCELVGWEDGTATFLVTVATMDGSDIPGGKITFQVRELLTGKTTYDDITVPVDWSSVGEGESRKIAHETGGSGLLYETYVSGDPKMLVPGTPLAGFPVEGVDLTAIGYVDGLLHIQTQVADLISNDNHGYFWLETAEGERVDAVCSVSATNGQNGADRLDWQDMVFDIAPSDLAGCTLKGEFVAGGSLVKGNWSITFQAENQGEVPQ